MQYIKELYGGEVKIIVKERNWRGDIFQTYHHEDGTKIISVTEATGMVNKPRLIDWAVKMMREDLIAKRNRGVLLKIPEIIDSSYAHKRTKQDAADKGKKIHNWCEQYIKYFIKECLVKPTMPEDGQVLNGVLAFMKWEQEHRVKWIAAEHVIYSRVHDYAGRMDAKARVDGKLCAIDFKTGNAVYNEHRYQVAGYQEADVEESKNKYTGEKWLLRFDKNTAEFEADQYGEHDEDFKSFLAALQLKKRDNQLTGKDAKAKKPVILPY